MTNNGITGKTILVTGATGSIGSEIIRQLLLLKVKQIIGFSRDEIKQFIMKQSIDDKRLILLMGDIRYSESLENAFDRYPIDMVFHAAAMKHLVVCEDEPIECAKTNIIGTHNLIRLCVKHDIPHVVTISTDKAASPTSVMGASKFIAERITLNGNSLSKNGKFSSVRFGNVANSRGSVIPIMVDRIINDQVIHVTNNEVTRFIMRISDAVSLVIKAAVLSQGGEIFILKMPTFKLGTLVDVLSDRIGPSIGKQVRIELNTLVQGEKVHEELLNEIERRNIFENDEMFIIPGSLDVKPESYPGFSRSVVNKYSSSDVQQVSDDELEDIVLEYMNNKVIRIS